MEKPIAELLHALREWTKAHDRLARAVPDPERAAAAADAAFEQVLSTLDEPRAGGLLNSLIPSARDRILADPQRFAAELEARRAEILAVEALMTKGAGGRLEDIERLYRLHARARRPPESFPDGADALKEDLKKIHGGAKQGVADSRPMGRKRKKKVKRKIAQGLTSALFGAAVIAANTQLPALFAFSYGLGGAALHQALRDFAGEPAE